MMKTTAQTLIFAALASGLVLVGCTKDDAPKATVQVVSPKAAPAEVPQEVEADAVPSSTERDMALRMGMELVTQGKLEEAEAKLKVAAAGGSAEGEKLLVRVRVELEAKKLVKGAKEKMAYGDYEGAAAILARVSQASSLRKTADQLIASIDAKKAAMERALEAGLRQGLNDDSAEAGESSEEAAPTEEEASAEAEAAPAEEAPNADAPAEE